MYTSLLFLLVIHTAINFCSSDCEFGICEHIENYPKHDIERSLEKYPVLHGFFGGNVVEPSSPIKISTKTDQSSFEPLCKTRDRTVVPQMMLDEDGFNRTIINTKKYRQTVTFRICNPNSVCFPGLISGYNSSCEQQYNTIKLVSLGENGEPEYRRYTIPSTCSCTYLSN